MLQSLSWCCQWLSVYHLRPSYAISAICWPFRLLASVSAAIRAGRSLLFCLFILSSRSSRISASLTHPLIRRTTNITHCTQNGLNNWILMERVLKEWIFLFLLRMCGSFKWLDFEKRIITVDHRLITDWPTDSLNKSKWCMATATNQSEGDVLKSLSNSFTCRLPFNEWTRMEDTDGRHCSILLSIDSKLGSWTTDRPSWIWQRRELPAWISHCG